jgi:hypothetical protein
MKVSFSALTLLAIASIALLESPSAQGQVVYSNGPINGTIDAWNISMGFLVTDSFTVTTPTALTGVTFGAWVNPGATPVSVDWAIGTSAFASDVSLGNATLTNVLHNHGTLGISDVYASSFAITGSVGTGTYWLTLTNAMASDGSYGFWDENDGPSMAQQSFTGPVPSHAFQITAGFAATPEPDSIALLATSALTGAGFLARRKKAQKAA